MIFHMVTHSSNAHNSTGEAVPPWELEAQSWLCTGVWSYHVLPPKVRVGRKLASEAESGPEARHCSYGMWHLWASPAMLSLLDQSL